MSNENEVMSGDRKWQEAFLDEFHVAYGNGDGKQAVWEIEACVRYARERMKADGCPKATAGIIAEDALRVLLNESERERLYRMKTQGDSESTQGRLASQIK